MDKGRHANVVRTWMAGKVRKPRRATKAVPAPPRRPERHNKT